MQGPRRRLAASVERVIVADDVWSATRLAVRQDDQGLPDAISGRGNRAQDAEARGAQPCRENRLLQRLRVELPVRKRLPWGGPAKEQPM